METMDYRGIVVLFPNGAEQSECPATVFRQYVEGLVKKQQEYILKGILPPEEYTIPNRTYISKECIERINESKYEHILGASDSGNQFKFYWVKTDEAPALEVIIEEEISTGKFFIKYIKEDSMGDIPEFCWNNDDSNNNSVVHILYNEREPLEDTVTMKKVRR